MKKKIQRSTRIYPVIPINCYFFLIYYNYVFFLNQKVVDIYWCDLRKSQKTDTNALNDDVNKQLSY